MRRAHLRLALLAALAVSAVAVVPASGATALSASQTVARFKAATGSKLQVDKRASSPGHYTALVLAPSISNQAKYGRFTLYVVAPGATNGDVRTLLTDTHTGVLGAPGPSNIFWEQGRYLTGGTYWLAKKQYGANLVLWWYGPEKKVNAAFKRVHRPLLTTVAAS
jgi:hypothetical protein